MGICQAGTILARRLQVAAALVLPLVTLSLVPQSAHAGCGDYVIFRHAGKAARSGHNGGMTNLAARGELLPGQAPCQGPMCRGSRPLDPAPSPPPLPQIDERPLALLSASRQTECPSLISAFERYDQSPRDGYLTSILRPPCA